MANIKTFKNPNYDEKLDFQAIALQDADFAAILSSNRGVFNFHKPEHVLQLTKSLLKRDFGLKLKLPDDRLCPPIPIRWSYIRWIQGLIDSTSNDYHSGYDASRRVVGIDIGIGSSCIYPLLGCTARPNWNFVGTDIDEKNFNHAVYNATNNNLDRRIRLVKTLPNEPFLDLKRLKIEKADFTMCNPPFFESKEEMMSTFDKDSGPSTICTGGEVEMVTEGGEVAYVSRMVDESIELGEKIQWYTSQLGKAASMPIIINKLKALGCSNWAVGILNPSEKTRRWVVGWSWGELRPKNDIARNKEHSVPQVWPTEYAIAAPQHTKEALVDSVNGVLSELSLVWSYDFETSIGLGVSRGNVWSRQARRKRKLQEVSTSEPSSNPTVGVPKSVACLLPSSEQSIPEMVFRVSVATGLVTLRWLKGVDEVLWDSFCGMMRRKLTGNIANLRKKEEGKANGEVKDEVSGTDPWNGKEVKRKDDQ